MKDYDNIIRCFDDIEDLPLSEEMLGAYIEGNLDSEELIDIGYLVQEDSLLSTLANEVSMDDFMEADVDDISSEEIPNPPEIIDFVPFDNTVDLQHELEELSIQTDDLCDFSNEEYLFEDDVKLNETQFDDANEDIGINDTSLEEPDLNEMEI